jgi:anti-sigma regulatory factor (Ser/Thr protein kinase)
MTGGCCLIREPEEAASGWPRQTHLELAALPTAVSCARGHVRSVTVEWGLAGLSDTAELLVSELMTNALRASERLPTVGPPVVRLWLASDRNRFVIHVWDGSDQAPVRQHAGPAAESGRGLMLVEHLAKDWGSYRKANGKVVWAVMSTDDES